MCVSRGHGCGESDGDAAALPIMGRDRAEGDLVKTHSSTGARRSRTDLPIMDKSQLESIRDCAICQALCQGKLVWHGMASVAGGSTGNHPPEKFANVVLFCFVN